MNTKMLEITTWTNKRDKPNETTRYISLIDFKEDDPTIKCVLNNYILHAIYGSVYDNYNDRYVTARIITMDEFMELVSKKGSSYMLSKIVKNVYVIKDSNQYVRLVGVGDKDSSFYINMIPSTVIRIIITEGMEIVRENIIDSINPYIAYKTISGTVICSDPRDNTKHNLQKSIHTLLSLYGYEPKDTLHILIQYMDARVSTIEYVEKEISKWEISHTSFLVQEDKKASCVEYHEDGLLIIPISEDTSKPLYGCQDKKV